MAIERTSKVVWEGDLIRGNGKIEFTSSGLPETSVTWASRTERPGGKTSPEELLAAAHASCFSMAFSAGLSRSRHPPKKLTVSAKCLLDKVGDGFKITDIYLEVKGEVEGISVEEFKTVALNAEQGCPVSNALRNNVNIHVEATLQ